MSSDLERRVAKLEHDHRIDREQLINMIDLVLELVAIVDPEAHQQATDDVAAELGYEPGGRFVRKGYGSETN